MTEPKTAKQTITKRDGVDAYGLYVEYLRYYRNNGTLHSQVQVFLVGSSVYVYQRKSGAKKARWTMHGYKSFDEAKEQMRSLVAKSETPELGSIIRGNPTLVQLTETDVEAVNTGLKPVARYDGGTRNNRLLGKIDDSNWKNPKSPFSGPLDDGR